jgi:hypothetical protein
VSKSSSTVELLLLNYFFTFTLIKCDYQITFIFFYLFFMPGETFIRQNHSLLQLWIKRRKKTFPLSHNKMIFLHFNSQWKHEKISIYVPVLYLTATSRWELEMRMFLSIFLLLSHITACVEIKFEDHQQEYLNLWKIIFFINETKNFFYFFLLEIFHFLKHEKVQIFFIIVSQYIIFLHFHRLFIIIFVLKLFFILYVLCAHALGVVVVV